MESERRSGQQQTKVQEGDEDDAVPRSDQVDEGNGLEGRVLLSTLSQNIDRETSASESTTSDLGGEAAGLEQQELVGGGRGVLLLAPSSDGQTAEEEHAKDDIGCRHGGGMRAVRFEDEALQLEDEHGLAVRLAKFCEQAGAVPLSNEASHVKVDAIRSNDLHCVTVGRTTVGEPGRYEVSKEMQGMVPTTMTDNGRLRQTGRRDIGNSIAKGHSNAHIEGADQVTSPDGRSFDSHGSSLGLPQVPGSPTILSPGQTSPLTSSPLGPRKFNKGYGLGASVVHGSSLSKMSMARTGNVSCRDAPWWQSNSDIQRVFEKLRAPQAQPFCIQGMPILMSSPPKGHPHLAQTICAADDLSQSVSQPGLPCEERSSRSSRKQPCSSSGLRLSSEPLEELQGRIYSNQNQRPSVTILSTARVSISSRHQEKHFPSPAPGRPHGRRRHVRSGSLPEFSFQHVSSQQAGPSSHVARRRRQLAWESQEATRIQSVVRGHLTRRQLARQVNAVLALQKSESLKKPSGILGGQMSSPAAREATGSPHQLLVIPFFGHSSKSRAASSSPRHATLPSVKMPISPEAPLFTPAQVRFLQVGMQSPRALREAAREIEVALRRAALLSPAESDSLSMCPSSSCFHSPAATYPCKGKKSVRFATPEVVSLPPLWRESPPLLKQPPFRNALKTILKAGRVQISCRQQTWEGAAARRIQAVYRGFILRRSLAAWNKAAVRIQSAWRGYLIRRNFLSTWGRLVGLPETCP